MFQDKINIKDELTKIRLEYEKSESAMFDCVIDMRNDVKQLNEKIDNIEKNYQQDKQMSDATIQVYSSWCKSLMDKIEQIAKEKYPDIDIWCDTSSRFNVCIAMLELFRKDL